MKVSARELMARGGMRVGEVLNLTPVDIQERTFAVKNPKSGRTGKTVYVPRKQTIKKGAINGTLSGKYE